MAISLKRNAFLSRVKPLLSSSQRWFNRGLVEGGAGAQYHSGDADVDSVFQSGIIKMSKWKMMDSRSLGIRRSMISFPSLVVLQMLQSQGHEAYLVGGCVRDLLLKKTPKDFDVITTAGLKQIQRQFHRAQIVGRRFPICRVRVKGSVIEVSSFETVARQDKNRKKVLDSLMPKGCDYSDFIRWKNSIHRDFTINSLFFDPFLHKIYDYANGMKDLLDLKLRTLLPAQLSFKEDSARILRGLRIAARLGLSLSNEAEAAIYELASSVSRLDKSRVSMELNYMLSYGAAEPSVRLLRRFHLLDLFLPFHAAFLSQQASKPGPMMLMRLFCHLDRLVACDRPSDSSLWIGLLVFHLTLVMKPQHPHVVFTFASVLYHEKWNEGVEFARHYSQAPAIFVPETLQTHSIKSDDELATRVKEFSLQVKESIHVFTKKESLLKAMEMFFPNFPCSGLVFVTPNKGKHVCNIFDVPVHDDLNSAGRTGFRINYDLLGKGDAKETRFVLGKIIMDTMNSEDCQGGHTENIDKERKHGIADSKILQDGAKKKFMRKAGNLSEQGTSTKQNGSLKIKLEELMAIDENLDENAYDDRLRDNAIKKSDEVAISLIEKNVGRNAAKEKVGINGCTNVSKQQEELATSQSPWEKVIGNLEKQAEVVVSLLEKMKGQKVAVDDKVVVNNACDIASKKHEEVAISQSPGEKMMAKLAAMGKNKSEKHVKRSERFKETLVDLGECFAENKTTQKQQKPEEGYDPSQGKKVRIEKCHANQPQMIIKDNETRNGQIIKEMDRKLLKLSNLFK